MGCRICKTDYDYENDFESKKFLVLGKSVIFILGGPGSGKGTQCAKIAENFGYKHISVDDLVRTEVKNNTVAAGDLTPSELTVQLL